MFNITSKWIVIPLWRPLYVCVNVCIYVCTCVLPSVLGCCTAGDNGSGNTPLQTRNLPPREESVALWLCGPLQNATTTVARGSHASGECFVQLTIIYTQSGHWQHWWLWSCTEPCQGAQVMRELGDLGQAKCLREPQFPCPEVGLTG